MVRLGWITLIIALLVTSCQKQSPDEIQPDYTDSLSQVRRGEACSRTNLLEDILYLDNLKNLFVCTGWEEKFPEMYKSLLELDAESWDSIVEPVNKHFGNKRDVRDNMISLFSDLDRKGGLEDFSNVLLAFNDSNFFSHVSEILECTKSTCPQGLERKDIENFFKFFVANKEELKLFASVAAGTSHAFKNEGSALVDSFKLNLSRESFLLVRNAFLNALFVSMGEERFREDLVFYQNMLSEEGDVGWFPSFVKSEVGVGDLVEIFRFPVDKQPEMWKDFRLLKEMLRLTIPCEVNGEGNQFTVIIKEHLNTFVESLFKGSREDFLDYSTQSVLLLKGAALVCPNLESFTTSISAVGGAQLRHSLNFVESLEETSLFLNKSENYSFVKSLNNSYPDTTKEKLYIIDYFATDTFATAMNVLRDTSPGTNSFTGALMSFFKATPTETYIDIAKVIDWLLSKDETYLKSLSKVWIELGEEGRYFLFNVFDSHFVDEANISLLFDFYTATLNVGGQSFENILKEWFEEDQLTDTVLAFEKAFKVLGQPKLLNDYRKFFSRDHIVAIIKLLSSGVLPDDSEVALQNYYLVEDNIPLNYPVFVQSVQEGKRAQCLKDLARKTRTFYVLLNDLPTSCSENKGEDPLFDIFYSINDFASFMEEKNGLVYTITDKAVFSPESVRFVTSLLKQLDDGYGLYSVLIGVRDWLKDPLNEKALETTLGAFEVILPGDESLVDSVFAHFSMDSNFSHMKSLVIALSESLKNYQDFRKGNIKVTDTSYTELEKYSCQEFHSDVGGRPCPTPAELLTLYKRALFFMKKKNDDNPTALEQLLRLVAVDYGLPIPYESENPTYKRIGLIESFNIFYDLTNKDLDINKLVLEHHPVPDSVIDYFTNENWEVTSKMGRNAPDESDKAFTSLERVETVIRDVRFDNNYLGAHYLNAVAKAEDYNDVVDSKYGLFKTCVPLKFCGKFMNRGQHKLGKNAKETFKVLLDVNTENGWQYGNYMQALLMSLVSSSPDKAQISSVVNRRFLGININIPWLQAKEDLIYHNGQILGIVSMAHGFTNGARIIRDRVGRTPEEFKAFLKDKRLLQLEESLFRNFEVKEDLPKIEKLLEEVLESGLLESFFNYFSEADYEQTRLAENLIYRGLALTSYIADPNYSLDKGRFSKQSLFSLLDFITPLLKHHDVISELIDFKDKKLLRKFNSILSVLEMSMENKESAQIYANALNEVILLLDKKSSLISTELGSILSNKEEARKLIDSLSSIDDLYSQLFLSNSIDPITEKLDFYAYDNGLDWKPVQNLLRKNTAEMTCDTQGEVICEKNKQKGELREFLRFLLNEEGGRLLDFFKYPTDDMKSKIDNLIQKVFPSLILEPQS